MHCQIRHLALQTVTILLSLTQRRFCRNNNIAKKMLLRSAQKLRLITIIAVLIQRKAQHIRRLIHATVLAVQRMNLLIIDNRDIHLGLLRQLVQACHRLQALLQTLQHLRCQLQLLLIIF